jgi:hypothetical protein
MLFDDQYPDAEEGTQSTDRDFEVIKLASLNPCWHCSRPTRWVELNFESHLCSEECTDAKWKEYFAACNKTNGH